jgi:hypothetical protein
MKKSHGVVRSVQTDRKLSTISSLLTSGDAKLQLGGFAAKALVWMVTLLICVGIWIVLGLLVRWFVAPSPFPLS